MYMNRITHSNQPQKRLNPKSFTSSTAVHVISISEYLIIVRRWRIGRIYPGIEEREDGRAGRGKERGEAVVSEVWSPGTGAQNHREEDPTR